MTTMQPKIAIGCPVRNRAWVLPEYLQALDKIDYENKMYLFLENDSEDETMPVLADFYYADMDKYVKAGADQAERCNHYDRVRVEQLSTGAEMWNHGDYAHEQYANLARVRNHFLDMFLRTDADFLLSVDSDVIVPPDIVARLLRHMEGDREIVYEAGMPVNRVSHKQYIVGAAISNVDGRELNGSVAGNFQVCTGGSSYAHHSSYPMHGIFEVDLIGAVYLIPRSVIEAGARYAPHPTGEDAPFCEAARRLGYRLLVDMDVRCEHRMVKPCK